MHDPGAEQLTPPAIRILPLFNKVALWRNRPVLNVSELPTIKLIPTGGCPDTATTIGPVVAPLGTGTVMLVSLQFDGVAIVPLNEIALVPCVIPKPDPEITTELPTSPDEGLIEVITGTGKTVNGKLLLGLPIAVVTT